MPGERNRTVNCPQCGAPTPWGAGSPFRPFCSERCKLIDLGQWASEGYRLPVTQDDALVLEEGVPEKRER